MKIFRFAAIALALSLLLGTFAPIAATPKLATAAIPSTQAFNSAALDLSSAFSPFMFAASSPVLAAGAVLPGNSTAGYACKLTAQSPVDWTTMKKRTAFNVSWTLKNTGTKVWGIHGVDVRYRGDTRMHYNVPDLFDLPKKVGLGQSIKLTLDMITPKLPGYYVSNWGLYLGNLVFCKFYVIVVVPR